MYFFNHYIFIYVNRRIFYDIFSVGPKLLSIVPFLLQFTGTYTSKQMTASQAHWFVSLTYNILDVSAFCMGGLCFQSANFNFSFSV